MRKFITTIIAFALLIGGYFFSKSMVANKKKRVPTSEKVIQSVFVQNVKNEAVPIQIIESGRLVAKNKIEIYAEVQGVMEATPKEFKPGSVYNKGAVLVKIRSADYYANLQAQKSTLQNLITSVLPDLRLDYPEAYKKWDEYLQNFDMNKPISKLPETSSDKEKYFITGKNIYTTYYKTKNLEIILQKYTLRAPFNGILTEAVVTPGTVVRPGQKLGEFINPSVYEMEVSVKKTEISSLAIGKNVQVKGANSTQVWDGKITRINGKVDVNTQTVKVFIQLNSDELREGMYMEANMNGNPIPEAFEVASGLLIEGSKLYVVKNNMLDVVVVSVLHKKHNSVVIQGLEDGMQLVSKPIAGAYAGMEVSIANNN